MHGKEDNGNVLVTFTIAVTQYQQKQLLKEGFILTRGGKSMRQEHAGIAHILLQSGRENYPPGEALQALTSEASYPACGWARWPLEWKEIPGQEVRKDWTPYTLHPAVLAHTEKDNAQFWWILRLLDMDFVKINFYRVMSKNYIKK